MASNLAGKIFTVTGGASGMGAATAKLLAQRSAAAVCIADRQVSLFEPIRKELSEVNPSTKVMATELDVSSSYSVARWLDQVVAVFGRLDGCANVAGVAQPVGARDSPTILGESDETWKKTMGVNLDGIMYCTREQVRTMVQLPKAPRTIVNVSSLASYIHTPDAYAYSASKRACASFSTSVAKDVHGFDIRVNTVSPGKPHQREDRRETVHPTHNRTRGYFDPYDESILFGRCQRWIAGRAWNGFAAAFRHRKGYCLSVD